MEHGPRPDSARWIVFASGAAALLLVLTVYVLRRDRVVGMCVDDAWYTLLAKALATGHGYTLINSPTPGVMPLLYPPGFPWVLSLAFRLSPRFPENIWLLKSVSTVAMLGVGIVSYRYFLRDRALPFHLALGIAVATVLIPAFAFLATSTVMSECVFTLAQLSTIVVIERCARHGERGAGWRDALLGSAFASFAVLTRSMAVGLALAALVYLLKERRLRSALVFVAAVAVLVGSWTLYARAHAPTEEQKTEQSSYIVQSYATSFWQRQQDIASSGTITLDALPGRIWDHTVAILGIDMGGILVAPLFRSPQLSGIEAIGVKGGTRGFLFVLSAVIVVGFISAVRDKITLAEIAVPVSLLITVAWPWWPFRYVLPLAPFVIFYLLMGVRTIHRLTERALLVRNHRAQAVVLGVVVWSLAALSIYDHVSYLESRRSPAGGLNWVRNFGENEEMLTWMRDNLPSDQVIASTNPALVYLYTAHKTIGLEDPAANWETWNRFPVRYAARLSVIPVPNPDPDEGEYSLVYRSRGGLNLWVVDFGAKAWGQAQLAQLAHTLNLHQ